MALAVSVLLATAFAGLGADRALVPGTSDPSPGWIAISVVVGLSGALLGGWLSARVGGPSASKWLAGFVVTLGLLMAVPVAFNGDPADGGIRRDDATMTEVLAQARQPLWVAILNPFLGAAGVLVGARLRRH